MFFVKWLYDNLPEWLADTIMLVFAAFAMYMVLRIGGIF
jgi:hypothetical protein